MLLPLRIKCYYIVDPAGTSLNGFSAIMRKRCSSTSTYPCSSIRLCISISLLEYLSTEKSDICQGMAFKLIILERELSAFANFIDLHAERFEPLASYRDIRRVTLGSVCKWWQGLQ